MPQGFSPGPGAAEAGPQGAQPGLLSPLHDENPIGKTPDLLLGVGDVEHEDASILWCWTSY